MSIRDRERKVQRERAREIDREREKGNWGGGGGGGAEGGLPLILTGTCFHRTILSPTLMRPVHQLIRLHKVMVTIYFGDNRFVCLCCLCFSSIPHAVKRCSRLFLLITVLTKGVFFFLKHKPLQVSKSSTWQGKLTGLKDR